MSVSTEDDFDRYHEPENGRVIVIGKGVNHHDWMALHYIAEYMQANGDYDLFSAIAINDLDHYDMTTKPEKGDAIDAIRRHNDVTAVITLHVFGLDRDYSGKSDPYLYSRENHKLLELCVEKGIPLICWGDQPVATDGVTRHEVGASVVLYDRNKKNGDVGALKPIIMYNPAD